MGHRESEVFHVRFAPNIDVTPGFFFSFIMQERAGWRHAFDCHLRSVAAERCDTHCHEWARKNFPTSHHFFRFFVVRDNTRRERRRR
jgi:hypothetical protein